MSTAKSKNMDVVASAVAVDWWRVASVVLCVLGLLVAGYMSWAELTGNETVCADTGKIDCSTVQQSAYAETLGIPVAVIGFLGYVAMLGVLALEDQVDFLATFGRTLMIGMALFGVIFQVYLTIVEATVLDAWCQWCVASFVIITALLIVSGIRFGKFLEPLQK